MRSSIALSALVLMSTVSAQNFLTAIYPSTLNLEQGGGNNRIDIKLSWFPSNDEKYALIGNFRVGAGPALNGSNETNMNLVIDTRTQKTFVFDSSCINCNVTNKYTKNPNATELPLDINIIKHVKIKEGYIINDTICVPDSNGNGNMKCAPDRLFGVVQD
jgi:hypothetical protein